VVAHGYHHLDGMPCGLDPLAWVKRRIYTAGEGELSALSQGEAARLLEETAERFRRLEWPLGGFVAPAWLLSPGARKALRSSPFSWTSTRTQLVRLSDGAERATSSLVWSVRSGWRRTLSRHWNDHILGRDTGRSLLRMGLHPADLRYPQVADWWLEAIGRVLEARRPMSKGAWVRTWG
jgi:predicted deacetylase